MAPSFNAPVTQPMVVVVMGVSGTGKSTVARELATAMHWPFAEGDDFHSAANVAKMHGGQALTDDDRWPWLESIGAWIGEREQQGESGVVTCSALRRAYRDVLRRDRPVVRFLHVTVPPEVIQDRIERRTEHFMPASLLGSQLDTLEPLQPDEPGALVVNEGTPAAVVDRAIAALGLTRPGA
ncbi:gluconokinase [Intrasporangium mesophilum]